MKLTQFTFYKNTPLTDVNNTIHFKNNDKRDEFFNNHYEQKTTDKEYNFIRESLVVSIDTTKNGLKWQWLQNVNYCRLKSDFEFGAYYYCYVPRVEYVNERTTKLYLIIDGIMTFCQGDFTIWMNNMNVQRQHLPAQKKQDLLPYLRTNSDVINVGKKYYSGFQNSYYFTNFLVILRSTVKLHNADFGDVNNPKITGVSGGKYDGVVGAQELYAVSYDKFSDFMSSMKDFPWVTRNISKVQIVPRSLVNLDGDHADQQAIDGATFYHLKSNSDNILNNAEDKVYVPSDSLYGIFNLNQQHPETFREEYASIIMTGYNGQNVTLNPALLKNDELKIRTDSSVGYQNEVRFYPWSYGLDPTDDYVSTTGEKAGSYMDNAIIFKNFDTVPVVVDTGLLSVAGSANARRVGNEKTLQGALSAQADPSVSANDKFMIGASQTARWINGVGSNLLKGNVGGALSSGVNMVSDDYWHFRQQNAQIQDSMLQAPSVSEQTTNNAFNIKHDVFGLTVKYQVVPRYVMRMVENYHSRFGYQFDFVTSPESIESMSKLNYLRTSGTFRIGASFPDIPTPIFKQIEAQLESGVTFWHNPNGLENPFDEDISDNVEVK